MGVMSSVMSQEIQPNEVLAMKHPNVKYYLYSPHHLVTKPCCPICRHRTTLGDMCYTKKHMVKADAGLVDRWDAMANESRARIKWKPTCSSKPHLPRHRKEDFIF